MAPTGDLDEGLVFASRAGLVSAQSVRGLRERALAFRAWLIAHPPARGPRPDVDDAVRMFLVEAAAEKIRAKLGRAATRITAAEAAQVWALLFGTEIGLDVVRMKLGRLRPRLVAFAASAWPTKAR